MSIQVSGTITRHIPSKPAVGDKKASPHLVTFDGANNVTVWDRDYAAFYRDVQAGRPIMCVARARMVTPREDAQNPDTQREPYPTVQFTYVPGAGGLAAPDELQAPAEPHAPEA